MAVVYSGFESGSNGDTLTTGNTGFTGGTGITGGTGVISTAQKAHGTRSALFTGTGSGNLYLYDTITATQVVARTYAYFTAFPSGSDQAVIWLGNGSSQRSHLEVSSTGAVRFRDDANAAQWIGSTTTSTGTMSLNTWYRLELMVTLSATAGTYRIAVYPGDTGTPVSGMDSGVRTTANGGGGLNTGGDSYTQIRFGAKSSSNAGTVTMYMDDWAYDTGTTTLLGAYVDTLTTPSVSLGTTTNPSTVGASNGSQVVTWSAVAGATSYEAWRASGSTPTQGDFTQIATGVTSPYTFTGLTAGTYSFGIKAKA